MKTIIAKATLAVCAAALIPSCASTKKTAAASMSGARVIEVQTTVRDREISGIPAAYTATHLGIVGSAIGRGAAANAAGALGGAIVGGIIGYIGERNAAHTVTHTVKVKLDDGRYYVVQAPLKKGAERYRLGQKVWMAMDARGVPLRIVDVPAM